VGEFPEIDRADWSDIEESRRRLMPYQEPFLDRLVELLEG
jgi:predicted NUDIX family NTP pyrophosphohydrolase